MLHMASRDIAHVTVREVKAAEDALQACREMLEVPVQTAMLAMCCAAPQGHNAHSSADDAVLLGAGAGAGAAAPQESPRGSAVVAAAAAAAARRNGDASAGGVARVSSAGALPAWVGEGGAGDSPHSRA
jgi:hypothetical protein